MVELHIGTNVLCFLGIFIFYMSWVYDREEKYLTKNSLGVVEKDIVIQNKLINNEKLTLAESFHLYSYKIWYVFIRIGRYGGIFLFIIGCLNYFLFQK